MRTIRILATGSHACGVSDEPLSLKGLLEDAGVTDARRTSRFAQLALLGAARCVSGRTLPPSTAIYLTSGRGDLQTTLEILVEICRDGHQPAPYAFINSVGNSACFHIAKTFGLSGPSQLVTRLVSPLAAAAQLARLDMTEGCVSTALVGTVDMCTFPLEEHRERVGMPSGATAGEGSHWLLLDAGNGADGVGVLKGVASFTTDDDLRRHLAAAAVVPAQSILAIGPHAPGDGRARLYRVAGIERLLDPDQDRPWHDSRAGDDIHRFLSAPPARALVHIDADADGCGMLIVVEAR